MVNFAKYEGAGNDFVVIDNRAGVFDPLPGVVARLCDRRFGIGADGLMLLEDGSGALFRMRYFNADGPEATMCGNGGRCIALFAHHLGLAAESMEFRAQDGIHAARILACEGEGGVVSLRMSAVAAPRRCGEGFFVDTGSPHYVEFVDDVDSVDVVGRGRRLRHDERFARRGGANVDFVSVAPEGGLRIRTYERGVEDETLACGTGAVAAVLAASAAGLMPAGAASAGDAISAVSEAPAGSAISPAGAASAKNAHGRDTSLGRVRVAVRGGELEIASARSADGGFGDIWLTGPARRVFSGSFDMENF